AALVARVDAGRLDRELHRRALGLGAVHLDRAGEVGELAAHVREDVTHLEADVGVRLVERVRVAGQRGRGECQGCGEYGGARLRHFGFFSLTGSTISLGADRVEQPDQRLRALAVERRKCLLRGRRHRPVEARQQPARLGGRVAEHLAAVARAARAAHQPPRLEPVEQPGDARALLDHARGDLQGGEAGVAGAAQDAQHVVLLQRDAALLDHLREPAAHAVGGRHQRDHAFLGERRERPRLVDLLPDRPHLREPLPDYLTSQVKGSERGQLVAPQGGSSKGRDAAGTYRTRPRAATRITVSTLPWLTPTSWSWRLATTQAWLGRMRRRSPTRNVSPWATAMTPCSSESLSR